MSLRLRKFGGMLAGAAPLFGAVISLVWLGWSNESTESATSKFLAMISHPFGAIAVIQAIYTALLSILWMRYRTFRAPAEVEWPKVTVVIPAFNEGPMVGRSIRSVAACSYPKDKLEVIVVDDGSRDDTFSTCSTCGANFQTWFAWFASSAIEENAQPWSRGFALPPAPSSSPSTPTAKSIPTPFTKW